MSLSEYKNRKVVIKSTGVTGKVIDVKHKRGFNGISVRMVIEDAAGAQHELAPHEFKFVSA